MVNLWKGVLIPGNKLSSRKEEIAGKRQGNLGERALFPAFISLVISQRKLEEFGIKKRTQKSYEKNARRRRVVTETISRMEEPRQLFRNPGSLSI